MDRETREKLYREQMGHEAFARQTAEGDRCYGCGAHPGERHSPVCRYGRGVKKARNRGFDRG